MDTTVRFKTVLWFATAVALGVVSTVIVTRAWTASAAPGDEDATLVPITPCRVVDQRDGDPTGPNATVTQQITGTNGDCTIPDDAVAVSMNVTIARPTATSYLTVFPADLTTPPTASNLNWTATSSPTPNKVDVKLSADGAVKFYNSAGNVFVIADIVGYYTSSTLQELADRVAALETGQLELSSRLGVLENGQPFVVDSGAPQSVSGIFGDTTITALGLTAPVAGTVTVMATAQAAESENQAIACSINTVNQVTDAFKLRWKDSGVSAQPSYGQLAGVRTFGVEEGEAFVGRLVCENEDGGASTVEDAVMVGLFTPRQ